jgi:hypothetical protein
VVAEWKALLLDFSANGVGKLELPPMNSFERRVVHALAEECGLAHTSAGEEGKAKCVVVTRLAGGGVSEGAAAAAASSSSSAAKALPVPASPPDNSFVVFEVDSGQITTADSRGLLCGVQPRGSGEWDVTVEATSKNAQQLTQQVSWDGAIACSSLEEALQTCGGCDCVYVCPVGGYQSSTCDHEPKWSNEADEPCACWQGKRHIPQNVCENEEWDGNAGSVSWETETHFFEMSYSTS